MATDGHVGTLRPAQYRHTPDLAFELLATPPWGTSRGEFLVAFRRKGGGGPDAHMLPAGLW
jgi:hypothetical protein